MVIDPGLNGVIESNPASSIIDAGDNGTLDSSRTNDDIIVGSRIFPGPNGVLDTQKLGDDVMTAADDELIAAIGQQNIAYRITATNVKARFTCADGEFVLLDNASTGQPWLCTEVPAWE